MEKTEKDLSGIDFILVEAGRGREYNSIGKTYL
jgi:hypothetical protein